MSSPAPVPRERKDDDLLTPAEVATIFRVDPKTVTRWAAAKPPRLPSIRTPGGHRRFRWYVVRRMLREQQDSAESLSRKPVINRCALPREDAMVDP
jgi:Helix-turn-helix domain